MAKVKAYSIGDKVVVQYFDSGKSDHLTCPHCSWSGSASEQIILFDSSSLAQSDITCPSCNAILGLVSPPLASDVEEATAPL